MSQYAKLASLCRGDWSDISQWMDQGAYAEPEWKYIIYLILLVNNHIDTAMLYKQTHSIPLFPPKKYYVLFKICDIYIISFINIWTHYTGTSLDTFGFALFYGIIFIGSKLQCMIH